MGWKIEDMGGTTIGHRLIDTTGRDRTYRAWGTVVEAEVAVEASCHRSRVNRRLEDRDREGRRRMGIMGVNDEQNCAISCMTRGDAEAIRHRGSIC